MLKNNPKQLSVCTYLCIHSNKYSKLCTLYLGNLKYSSVNKQKIQTSSSVSLKIRSHFIQLPCLSTFSVFSSSAFKTSRNFLNERLCKRETCICEIPSNSPTSCWLKLSKNIYFKICCSRSGSTGKILSNII